MGNRAVIKALGKDNKAVYLHWNGGRDSVEAFLKYCELRGFRGFEDDYGMARFCQVVGNYLGGDGLSIGITDDVTSQGDNGVYIVKGWEIIGRRDHDFHEQQFYPLTAMLLQIDAAQPLSQQLGDFLTAEEVPVRDIEVGDVVFTKALSGGYEKYTVAGIGGIGEMVNGTHVYGVPYVNKFGGTGSYTDNINNYIRDEFVKVSR